jgi:UPF0755 protein
MKKLLIPVVLALLAGGIGLTLAWRHYQDFLNTPLRLPPGGSVFVLPAGTGGYGIVRELAKPGITDAGWEWKVLLRLEPHVYRAGEYRLEPGMTPRDVLARLASGQVVQYRLTLVEGWTFAQFAAEIATNDVLKHEFDLLDPGGRAKATAALGLQNPEGWFLPETYHFTRGDSDFDILSRSHQAMQAALDDAWKAREPDLPLETPYELLTLASIVEKETAVESERSRIAGVFVRRLQRGMRLQTDPTVIYGLGDSFDGDLRRRDLDTDTPYNTYTRRGLPPTPIAMPGRASLMAAARPEHEEALYFVADGAGGHTFSVTLEEHQAAVRKLLGKH